MQRITKRDKNEYKPFIYQTRTGQSAWAPAMKEAGKRILSFNRSQIMALPAIRSVFGFAVPLVLGFVTHQIPIGVAIAAGASLLGTIGMTSASRVRKRILIYACIGFSFSAFVGSFIGNSPILCVLAAGIWGIGGGLMVALGQVAQLVGLECTLSMLLFTRFATDPLHAFLQALLTLIGAFWQTLLALIPLPLPGTQTERSSMAALYRDLADYAAKPADEVLGRNVRESLLKVQNVLAESKLKSRKEKLSAALLEAGERIRLCLLQLDQIQQLYRERNETRKQADAIKQVFQASSIMLGQIAHILEPQSPWLRLVPQHYIIKQALTRLRKQPSQIETVVDVQQPLNLAESIRDQLHYARKLARAWRSGQTASIKLITPEQPYLRLRDPLSTLKANLSFRSTAFRHAIRLGVTLALATALYRLIPLPLQRGYWIPLTTLLVLKPDWSTTLSRGFARALGTILGAVITTFVIAVTDPHPILHVIFLILFAYVAYALLYANYSSFSLMVTVMTVLMLAFVTPQPLDLALFRALDTAIGGTLAMLAYFIWPTWEYRQIPDNIADRLSCLNAYLIAVLKAIENPDAYNEVNLQKAQTETRLSRSNAETSVQRARNEPFPHTLNSAAIDGTLQAADNIAGSALILEGALLNKRFVQVCEELEPFRQRVDTALQEFVHAIKEQRSPAPLPSFKEELDTLERWRKVRHLTEEERAARYLLVTEIKHIIDNISIIHNLLSKRS
uniref:Uncharacterized protein n=1 Tax=Thermosporothrix sp. COM3 TaxID=2490863 RepID=A0A455SIY5_9CHLR|nr:hypothetical protein KTC_08560 [Thermosporothrix sp. COM3]